MPDYLIAIILALAIARLTLILVRDDIMIPVRELVFKYSPPEAHQTNERWDKNPDFDETRPAGAENPANVFKSDLVRAGWWGQVFSCPDCMGPYVATGTLLGYLLIGEPVLYFCAPFAASMVTSLIARQY